MKDADAAVTAEFEKTAVPTEPSKDATSPQTGDNSNPLPAEHEMKKRSTYERFMHKYPKLIDDIMRRDQLGDLQVQPALEYQKLGKALVLMPEDDSKVSSLTRDRDSLEDYYQQGLKAAEQYKDILVEKIGCD